MSPHPPAPPARRRLLAVALTAGAVGLGALGLAPAPASAAPAPYFSAVEGNLAIKGSPMPFDGVTISGTYDDETGELTATAVFPESTQVLPGPVQDTVTEVVLQVSQPEPATGTIAEDGTVTLDATFQILVVSATLVDTQTGDRSPLPLGPTHDPCRFQPIDLDLTGTATGGDGEPVTVSIADPELVIPSPPNPGLSCGPSGNLIIPNLAGPADGEDPNSAELSFVLSSTQAQVQAIYRAVLGRPADAGGLTYWSTRLDQGESPAGVATAIARTAEGWRNAVIDSYALALGRAPEEAGLRYWTESLVRAQDQPYLVGWLMSSSEADANAREAHPDAEDPAGAFVLHAYEVFLHRAPSEADLGYWVGRLDRATNEAAARQDVAELFYRSPEHTQVQVALVSDELCEAEPSGEQEAILTDAFRSSGFRTRVLRAVAAVTPCPTGG